MTYNIVATGSTGNATILNGVILIDCGVPYKALSEYAPDLKLVLLTHEHGDHFNPATVKRLAHERPTLRFGCCDYMVKHLLKAGVKKRQIDVLDPEFWNVYDFCAVVPFPLTHNVPNCGYRIDTNTGNAIYATDTGTLDGIEARDYDLYLIEANHTRAEIESRAAEKEAAGEFAYERRAAENHLSLEQAVDWLAGQMTQRSLWIPMHGHIQRNKGRSLNENGNETDLADHP